MASLKQKKKLLRFDFFLRNFNILIEYDGEQHFKANPFWGGDKAFQALVENDRRKDVWAKENGFQLIRISFRDEDKIEEVLTSSILMKTENEL